MKLNPTWRYHAEKNPVLIHSTEEEEALGSEWAKTPAAFENAGEPEIPVELSPVLEEAPVVEPKKPRKRASSS